MIKDINILRPDPAIYKIGSEEVDLSFVPNGITFEVDALLREITKVMSFEGLNNNIEKQKEAFDLSIDLCVLFCSRKHPNLNKKYFDDECNAVQIRAIVDAIKLALNNSYKAVEKYGKNL